MALFGRKMVVACVAVAFASLLMLGATIMIYYHNRFPCAEDSAFDFLSPDEQWNAELMERHCDNSFLIIHVYLHLRNEPVDVRYYTGVATTNDVFVMEYQDGDPEPSLEWNAPTQLTIRCPACRAERVKMHKDHWGPIAVRYQLSNRDNH